MQNTGISAIDTTIQKTNIWIKDVMEQLGWNDRHRAYLALRSVLHTLRDRLTIEEATDLGAQLPMLVRGFYYDGWNPSGKPIKFDKVGFLSNVSQQLLGELDINAEEVTQAVLQVIDKHVTDGEIEDIKSSLPADLREFWESQRT
jgi:uncharacterized protein (DUF2267 family)